MVRAIGQANEKHDAVKGMRDLNPLQYDYMVTGMFEDARRPERDGSSSRAKRCKVARALASRLMDEFRSFTKAYEHRPLMLLGETAYVRWYTTEMGMVEVDAQAQWKQTPKDKKVFNQTYRAKRFESWRSWAHSHHAGARQESVSVTQKDLSLSSKHGFHDKRASVSSVVKSSDLEHGLMLDSRSRSRSHRRESKYRVERSCSRSRARDRGRDAGRRRRDSSSRARTASKRGRSRSDDSRPRRRRSRTRSRSDRRQPHRHSARIGRTRVPFDVRPQSQPSSQAAVATPKSKQHILAFPSVSVSSASAGQVVDVFLNASPEASRHAATASEVGGATPKSGDEHAAFVQEATRDNLMKLRVLHRGISRAHLVGVRHSWRQSRSNCRN